MFAIGNRLEHLEVTFSHLAIKGVKLLNLNACTTYL